MTETSKLKPLAEQVLIGELVTQAKFAELAADQLEKTTDSIETWAAIQSILVATANVSKILWPPRKENRSRGERLRSLLGIENDNLLSDRTFRDHFEHYDERIERWLAENGTAVYSDLRIDPPFEPTPFSLPRLVHRSYNPSTQELSFRGDSIDLRSVLSAIAEVKAKCSRFALV